MSTKLMVKPIGAIRHGPEGIRLQVEEAYRPGLRFLELFSHAVVVWWANQHDNPESRAILQTELPYAPGVTAGVFACRAEYRPNPVAVTVCRVEQVDEDAGSVLVRNIDAYDGSPLVDIKPYIGVVDRVAKIEIPDWYDGWPEWLPEEGIGLDGS